MTPSYDLGKISQIKRRILGYEMIWISSKYTRIFFLGGGVWRHHWSCGPTLAKGKGLLRGGLRGPDGAGDPTWAALHAS